MKAQAGLLCFVLLATGLSGCIGSTDDPLDAASDANDAPQGDYVPLDEDALSQPTYEIGPRITDRVSATVDGIELFVEYWVPEGEGPFPTILHSTPYSHLDRGLAGLDENADEFFVARGYAYVVADVRGFGESQGCVEVWGENEQQDQADLVEWVAEQAWSDGNVGMMGASYPGTTPIEAATLAPEPLKAIVAVAGLTDPYYDWHFGGVPNGESGPVGSPAAYHGIGAVLPNEVLQGEAWAQSAADSGCQAAPFVLDAYQSDGVYTDFYMERNLTQRVADVEAAVLYTQGFEDGNVKPSQALNWFNELDTDKKGLFGPWAHEYPPRDDWTNMTLAWFDEHLQGKDTGVMEGPTVEVHTNLDTWRSDDAFPTSRANTTPLFLDPSHALTTEAPEEGTLTLAMDRTAATIERSTMVDTGLDDQLELDTGPLEDGAYISGVTRLTLDVTLEGAENALLSATLYAVDGDTREEITFGGQNLALRDDVRTYEPMPQGEPVTVTLRFQPVEHILEPGHHLELVLEPVDHGESSTVEASQASTLILHTGGDASRLALPLLEDRPDEDRPEDV